MRARWRFIGKDKLLDAAIVKRREVIGRCPVARSIFLAQVDDAGFHRLQRGGAIAEIIETHLAEIIAATVHGQILGPVFVAALVGYIFSGLEGLHLVRSRAQWRLERRLGEIDLRIIGLGENRQPGKRQRQVTRAAAVEAIAKLMRGQHVAGFDILDGDPDALVALGGQHFEAVADIISRDGTAIGKLCFLAQVEGDAFVVVCNIGRFRDKSIHGVGLVVGARHQAVEHQFVALHGVALEDIAVETVESVARRRADERELANLGGRGVHIVEMREALRIFQVAEHRDAVPRLRNRCAGGKCQDQKCRCDLLHFAATFRAFSSSHHQMVGKPME